MHAHPEKKYRTFPPVVLANRQWPSNTIDHAPIWMSSDLRDGNQALFEPMSIDKKLEVFELLCDIGFKEIEVGFPSASQTEFNFVRRLIEEKRIPDDVSIVVLTAAREPLIRSTLEAVTGAKQVIVHFYNATCQTFMDTVYHLDKEGVKTMAVNATSLIKTLADAMPQTKISLEYSPEHFSSTQLDFAVEICDAVTQAWEASPTRKVILNLPATVEVATPNVYADQIEWMHTKLARRDSVIISLHPHNDRGTAIAATELALMAGADRVEGCLFGNGERTGNVDLVTLALNLYSQGIHPNLDFSNINKVARVMESCTHIAVHPRHPYVGDLVFTAFSGSHQDAIKKGMADRKNHEFWDVPYMPIDPADLGRTYDSIIRVNSQSGKGGIAYLLETQYGVVMPRRMQVEFSSKVQHHADAHGTEVSAADIWQIFNQIYLSCKTPFELKTQRFVDDGATQNVALTLLHHGHEKTITGDGNGPIDATIKALASYGVVVSVRSYEERAMNASRTGGDAKACAMIEIATEKGEFFGVGIDDNIVTASLKAIFSAVNRAF